MSHAVAQPIHIAAVVNSDVITTNDLDARRALIMHTNNLPNTVESQKSLNPRILDGLINEALQMQEAKRLSIEINDEDIRMAMGKVDAARNQAEGTFERFVADSPELRRTINEQLRAQLAWNKVVERKLKRGINIAQDEIIRAQLAEAAAPGVAEVKIAAISLPIRQKSDEPRVATLAKNLSDQLNAGADFMTLAKQLVGTNQATLSPPVWVPESELQPGMQQALRSLQPKEITQPLRSQNSYQLIELLDRRINKATPDETEVVIKQISIAMPPQNKKALNIARETTRNIRANPGSCDDVRVGNGDGKATVTFVRATYRQMSRDLRSTVEQLHISEVSEPLLGDSDVKLVMLCERIEPMATLKPADEIRRKIFADKLELEAVKYLRNLRRDAFIDIKGGA
jgi:peptidyl-prolyl cis-trans isomerase SurA